jgi:hypothetical protein
MLWHIFALSMLNDVPSGLIARPYFHLSSGQYSLNCYHNNQKQNPRIILKVYDNHSLCTQGQSNCDGR